MKIGLVRRGYSATGGAEAYLQRLAAALGALGHVPVLITTSEWPTAGFRQILFGLWVVRPNNLPLRFVPPRRVATFT